jgi:hypothetical protein
MNHKIKVHWFDQLAPWCTSHDVNVLAFSSITMSILSFHERLYLFHKVDIYVKLPNFSAKIYIDL